jgi:anti-anti-sigma factor
MTDLSCKADTVPGNRHVVRLSVAGELDMTAAEVLPAAVAAAATRPALTAVEVDLQDVTFCDAAGITALLQAGQQAAGRNLGFRVIHARGIVHKVLLLTGVLATLTGTHDDPRYVPPSPAT